jgi:hypothetical protein
MTTLTRRQTLIGSAATVASAAWPAVAVAVAAPAKKLTCIGVTWDGCRPSRETAIWWEDRMPCVAVEARGRSVGVPRTYFGSG